MSLTIEMIRALVSTRQVVVSDHAYERMEETGIDPLEVLKSIDAGVVIEDYPDAHKGPSALVLQIDANGEPIHSVWGVQGGTTLPVVLVTAYRPDPTLWSADFRRRK
ncbi:MAG: DUF4258 domain-containing protein [Hyphomicrobiaceae bacterium]